HDFAEPLAAEGQHLVVVEPRRLDQLGASAGLLVLDVAGVRDLATALGIERRLLELRLERAVAELCVREDRRQHVRPLVTDELRTGAGYPYVHLELRALPRPLALLLHQPGELLFVHLEPTLGRRLLRQLPREA